MNLTNFIAYTISNIFLSISLAYSFSKVTSNKLKFNIRNLVIILVISLLLTLNNYYNATNFRIISAFLLTLIREKLIFKQNIKNTFTYVVIITFISIIIEFLLSPIVAIFTINIDNLNNNLLVKIIFSIINCLFLIFIMRRNLILKYINNFKNIIDSFINFYTLSIILICSLNIFMFFYSYNLRNTRLLIVVLICAIIILLFIRIIINDKNNYLILKEKNKILNEEHKAYAHTIDECRELKHNLKNELYSIKVRLPKEEQNMINAILTKYNSNYEWINTLNDIPEGLQGLIYLKIYEAKLKKIHIYLDIKSSLKTSENDYLDLGTILGILIDNAIEASEIAKSKTMVINIKEDKNIISIEIINKFANTINTKEIGKKNYSTKEYKSGLGLNFINNLNKTNIKVNFKITNDLFITNLEYHYQKK